MKIIDGKLLMKNYLDKYKKEFLKLDYKEKEANEFEEVLDIIQKENDEYYYRKNKKKINKLQLKKNNFNIDLKNLKKYLINGLKTDLLLVKEKENEIYNLDKEIKKLELYNLEYKENYNIINEKEKIKYLDLKLQLGLNE